MAISPLTITDLTTKSLTGTGAFDHLMQTVKLHLEQEFDKNRIKGGEYATVYLGSLEHVLQTSLTFLLQKDKASLESQMLEVQLQIAQVELEKVEIEKQKVEAELQILQATLPKIQAEVELIQAQVQLAEKQLENLDDQLLTSAKQREKLDAEIAIAQQQVLNLAAEKEKIDADTALTAQQEINLAAQKEKIDKETLVVDQQLLNTRAEETVLIAQECKLRAEFDVLEETKLKTAQETQLLTWRVVTEKAQTSGTGVDADSVIGKQKALFQAQTDGFVRDAEQKAAKIMVDSWNVRRTTDEATSANSTNKLDDASVGAAVTKLLSGIGA